MHKKIFMCAMMLLIAPINSMPEDAIPHNESSFMALIKSPLLFVKGCASVADSTNNASISFKNGSNHISESLDNTGENIKEAGKSVQEGLQSAAQSLKEAADKVSNITHTWDPESRQLSNAVVKEFAVSAFGLSIGLTGLYILYQSIYQLLLKQEKMSENKQLAENISVFQKIKHSLLTNSTSIAAGLVGLSLSCGGLKMIQYNSYLANTL